MPNDVLQNRMLHIPGVGYAYSKINIAVLTLFNIIRQQYCELYAM